jgi:hypothetical protein
MWKNIEAFSMTTAANVHGPVRDRLASMANALFEEA